jgi:hypothetical protein
MKKNFQHTAALCVSFNFFEIFFVELLNRATFCIEKNCLCVFFFGAGENLVIRSHYAYLLINSNSVYYPNLLWKKELIYLSINMHNETELPHFPPRRKKNTHTQTILFNAERCSTINDFFFLEILLCRRYTISVNYCVSPMIHHSIRWLLAFLFQSRTTHGH